MPDKVKFQRGDYVKVEFSSGFYYYGYVTSARKYKIYVLSRGGGYNYKVDNYGNTTNAKAKVTLVERKGLMNIALSRQIKESKNQGKHVMELKNFVFMDEIREAMEIAWATKSNLILVGPKGHGKSEFIRAFLSSKGYPYGHPDVYVKSLHGGLDEATLYGGLNFKALYSKTDPRLEYNFENSWLAHKIVVFEEIFDPPVSVLASLKDTLTAGFYWDGRQAIPVKTEVIFAATNREPEEVSALGASYDALLDRFPYIKRVLWEKYDQDAYLKMLRASAGEMLSSKSETVARMASRATEQGHFVSPRTCWIANKHVYERENFTPIRHIQDISFAYDELAEIERERDLVEKCENLEHKYTKICGMAESTPKDIKKKVIAFRELLNEFGDLITTNKTSPTRDSYIEAISGKISRLNDRIWEIV